MPYTTVCSASAAGAVADSNVPAVSPVVPLPEVSSFPPFCFFFFDFLCFFFCVRALSFLWFVGGGVDRRSVNRRFNEHRGCCSSFRHYDRWDRRQDQTEKTQSVPRADMRAFLLLNRPVYGLRSTSATRPVILFFASMRTLRLRTVLGGCG